MAYNLTNVTGGDNLLDIMVAADQLSGNIFFLLVSIALFVILLVSMVNRGFLPAFATSSFITGIAGILLVLAGLISQSYLVYYIVIMALAVAAAFVAGKGE